MTPSLWLSIFFWFAWYLRNLFFVMNYESDGDGGQVSLQRILNGRCSVRSLSRLEKSWTPQGYAATHQGAIVQRGRRLKFWFWISCTNFVCLCLFVIMLVFGCLSMRELVIIRPRLSHWAEKKEYNLTAENGNHGGVICHTHTACKFFINGGSIHFISFPGGRKFLWKHIGLKYWTFVA